MPYLLQETFEGAGLPSGWIDSNTGNGTLDYNYATAPAPLQGTQSGYILSTLASDANRISVETSAFSAASDCWFYVILNYSDDIDCRFEMLDVSDQIAAAFWMDGASNRFRVRNGPAGSGTSESIDSRAPSTTYHCWLRSNGVTADLYVSTDGTRPASPTLSNTGTTTSDIVSLSVNAKEVTPGGYTIFDYFRVADEELTDNGDLAGGPSVTLGWASPALYNSNGSLLASQGSVRVVISPDDVSAAAFDSGTTLTTDANGIVTIDSEAIGSLGDPISPTVWSGTENYTFTGQTVIDTSA